MYNDGEEIAQRQFAVCDFYGVETCFCWDADKIVIFSYTKGSWSRHGGSCPSDLRVLGTPAPIRKVQFFDSRAFFICAPQGAYKLSRSYEFALLSKNALGMGGEFFQVLIAKSNGVYLDDKQVKSSTLLFPLVPNASETVCTFPLNLASTEPRFASCFAAGWETKGNPCVIAHHRKLYALRGDTVQLIYTSNSTIVDILPAKRRDEVAGLLLLTEHANVVILVHGGSDALVFERIHLGENIKDCTALCAGFSLHMENILWIICCDRSRVYYIRKELFVDEVQEAKVEEKTFMCMQYYKPNVILGLSRKKELIEISLEELEGSLSINNNVPLHTEMFQRTDIIMENICAKVKELNVLYENLTDEQDKLKRINLYAAKRKLQVRPHIEVARLCKHRYLALNIPEKLPKNSYVVFSFTSKNQSTFCMKKVTESALVIKMPINENRILCSSSINMDLITLTNEQRPWCLLPNFINSPSQDLKRKRGPKKDKTAFILTKIASLLDLKEKKELTMTKLCEIKRIIRAEL